MHGVSAVASYDRCADGSEAGHLCGAFMHTLGPATGSDTGMELEIARKREEKGYERTKWTENQQARVLL